MGGSKRAMRLVASLIAGTGLYGCAADLPLEEGNCHIGGSRIIHSITPMSMVVRNEGQWCAVYYSISGAAGVPTMTVTQQPSHGEAKVFLTKSNGTGIAYRPQVGYTGDDNFAVDENASRSTFLFSVNVLPPTK